MRVRDMQETDRGRKSDLEPRLNDLQFFFHRIFSGKRSRSFLFSNDIMILPYSPAERKRKITFSSCIL
jgi:hypothetical protein